MRTSSMPLLFLLACQPSVPPPVAEPTDDPEHLGSVDPLDVEEQPYEELFDDTWIHSVAITLDSDDERDLRRDPYEYVDAAVTIDGATYTHVGLRLRGKIGSFRDLTGKPKFKIDFNHYIDGQRHGPYETLALNNEVVDCSYLREPTGYALFRALGLPAPLTTYTQVTVNGEDYGLYIGIEYPDDTFLDTHYADGSGRLYDGKYIYWGDYNYALVDFTPELVGNFTLEEGEDIDGADVLAITDAVTAAGTFDERLGPLVDTDALHRHLVGEQWIGHVDGYATNRNNYRVYMNPEDGRASLLVYDLDYAFYSAASWGMSWAAPSGVLAAACWADPACQDAQRLAVDAALADVDTDALLAQMDTWAALITDAAEADPRRECMRRQVGSEQANVRAWMAGAPDEMARAWSGN